MRQLERWNNENFRFSTPTVAQYLDGEKALASLEGMTPNGPAYVATPVMTAMVESPADLPSAAATAAVSPRAEEPTSELQSLMRHSYAVLCLKKKKSHQLHKH